MGRVIQLDNRCATPLCGGLPIGALLVGDATGPSHSVTFCLPCMASFVAFVIERERLGHVMTHEHDSK